MGAAIARRRRFDLAPIEKADQPPPRRDEAAPPGPPPAAAPQGVAPTVDLAEQRDKAVLRELGFRDRHCAMFRELLKVLPQEDQRKSEQERIEILQRVLTRLRARNQVDRTGTAWSLVGVGGEK